MDCRELEPILIELALGELTETEAAPCWEHIKTCSQCANALAEYQELACALAAGPVASPTPTETAALASALANVQLDRCKTPARPTATPRGFGEFVAASIGAFVLVAALLLLRIRGVIDIGAAFSGTGALRALGAFSVVVIITSFIPIAITARRRPLNGMTFRR